jgi:hypothetical protein
MKNICKKLMVSILEGGLQVFVMLSCSFTGYSNDINQGWDNVLPVSMQKYFKKPINQYLDDVSSCIKDRAERVKIITFLTRWMLFHIWNKSKIPKTLGIQEISLNQFLLIFD